MLNQLLADGVIRFPLDSHIDVFGVLAIDDHVEVLGTLVGTRCAFVVAAGTHAAIQIEDLPERDVEGTNATADWCGERAFDGDAIFLDGCKGVLRQILIGAVEVAGLIAGVHLEPLNAALAAVGLGHGGVEHLLGGRPDIHAGAVAADEGNDRIVGHHRLAVLEADGRAMGRGGELLVVRHGWLLTDNGGNSELSLGFRGLGFCCKGNGMNASDYVRSMELAQAVAAVAVLFRRQFPDAKANLTPWRDDPQTRAFTDPESVDLSFHLPGWSPKSQCRSFLVQLCLDAQAGSGHSRPQLLGVTIRGLTYESERWRMASLGSWQPTGPHLPREDSVRALQTFVKEVFELFSAGQKTTA